ncbi:MAG: DUF2569 domain-containing protein [Massilia sp.]
MTQYNPYQAPVAALTEVENEPAPADAAAEPIGGWLYLIGLSIVMSPFVMLAQMRAALGPFLENGAWASVTTPGAAAYHPLWGPLLVLEATIDMLFFASWVYMAYLFFSKKKALPKWYGRVQIGTLTFLILDTMVMQMMSPEAPLLDAETSGALVRATVSVCIWVPYMRMSDRVGRTFVRS